MIRELHKGDTIKCRDKYDAADVAETLSHEGIEWEFLYEKDDEEGIWIEITN
jgi:hypothetical protein